MIKRSSFDLSHRRKFSCDMGYLVPCYVEEVLPGDSFKVQSDMLVRLSPLIAPIMHEVNIHTHYWFVPNRLLFKDWEEFITKGVEGTSTVLAPYIVADGNKGFEVGSLSDYLGFPTDVPNLKVSALYHRAYNLIFNEWYRDQNLQKELPISLNAGEDKETNLDLVRRNWKKDYFTSALPFAQRGPSPVIPFGDKAPILRKNEAREGDVEDFIYNKARADVVQKYVEYYPGEYLRVGNSTNNSSRLTINEKNLEADLSKATGITVNMFREVMQLQSWLERSARAGARYVEQIQAHFGVRSSDARLQRPEYLGGGISPIIISEVLQTSSTDNTSPQGNMSGHGFSLQRSHQFKRFFEEHGVILGLVSIIPKSAYQQGLNRRFTRFSVFDYFFPQFAHLGEQQIKNKEIYATATDDDDLIFGYAPQYEDYRHHEDSVHGNFRKSLNYWHMGRIFDNRPKLNEDFIKCNPTKRINVITGEHNVYIDMQNKVYARRPLPKRGTPRSLF